MFSFLILLSKSVIYSVDFGSEFIKLGITLPGRIEIALNQQSKRYTPSFFALYNLSDKQHTNPPEHWDKKQINDLEWSFAYDAQSQYRRFPQNVVKGFPNLLNNSHGLTGREQMALILKHLCSTSADGKYSFDQSSLIFAVEPWLSRKERQALKESVEVGESRTLGITDSPTAAASIYAFERQQFYSSKPRTVAFLDLGQHHTWVSIFNFSTNGTEITADQLSVASNMTLGGQIIDDRVSSLFIDKFLEQNPSIKRDQITEKIKGRFLDEAKRAKERLTVTSSTDSSLDDIIDEASFSYALSRQEFESLLDDMSESINHLLQEALDKANITKEELDSIELLGGTTRVPHFNETIRNWSGMEKLNRTLNSDEAIAIGAGYVGVSSSGSFKFQKKMKINSFALCNVSAHDEYNNKYDLFTEYNRLTDKAYINFTVGSMPKSITVHVEGEDDFYTYKVDVPEMSQGDIQASDVVTFEFGFNEITIPVLQKVQVAYKNKLDFSIQSQPAWMQTKDQLLKGIGMLHKMQHVLTKRVDILKLKNDHESLIYKLRDRMDFDYDFLAVLTEEERDNISAEIHLHQEWQNNETIKKKKRALMNKVRQLERLTEEPDRRVYERLHRPEAIKQLEKTIKEVQSELHFIKKSKPGITEENLTVLREVLNSTMEWFDEKTKLIKQENVTSNPVVLSMDFNRKRTNLENRLDKVKAIPKPKPPKKPKTATNTTSHINGTSDTNETETSSINGTATTNTTKSKQATNQKARGKQTKGKNTGKAGNRNTRNTKKTGNKGKANNKKTAPKKSTNQTKRVTEKPLNKTAGNLNKTAKVKTEEKQTNEL